MLEDRIRSQIERTLGRPLSPTELAEASSLNELSADVLAVARSLSQMQLVLCVEYLGSLVPRLDNRTAARFIREVLEGGHRRDVAH